METTKKWNKAFQLVMFGMVLAFGLVLTGCASLFGTGSAPRADKGSVSREVITLTSADTLVNYAAKLGYSVKRDSVSGVLPFMWTPSSYPQADLFKFTITNGDGIKTEGILLRTTLHVATYSVGYSDATRGSVPRWVDMGTYETQNEANAAATTAKMQNPAWAPYITVKTNDKSEPVEYIAVKP